MTDDEREAFRRKLGKAVLGIQAEELMLGMPLSVFLPEMIAALMSLAAYIARENAKLNLKEWQMISRGAAKEQWP